MTRTTPVLLLLPVLLVGGGCERGSDERDAAAGQILPGSASDAMLQTDRLKAEAPLVAPKAATGEADDTGPGVPAGPGEAAAGEAAAPAEEVAAPAPPAAPEAASAPTPKVN